MALNSGSPWENKEERGGGGGFPLSGWGLRLETQGEGEKQSRDLVLTEQVYFRTSL